MMTGKTKKKEKEKKNEKKTKTKKKKEHEHGKTERNSQRHEGTSASYHHQFLVKLDWRRERDEFYFTLDSDSLVNVASP